MNLSPQISGCLVSGVWCVVCDGVWRECLVRFVDVHVPCAALLCYPTTSDPSS